MQITIPYRARPQQSEIYALCRSRRFGVAAAHRRLGKSVLFANALIREGIESKREHWRGAFIGPTYTQTKAILWDHIRNYSSMIPGIKYNESELRIDLPDGQRIRLFGADNPDSLRGLYLDMAVFDEFDLQKMEVWSSVVRPALSDRRGRAYFIGTYKYIDGPLGELYDFAEANSEDWFAVTYRASDTGILGGLRTREEIERLRKLGELIELSELEQAREAMSDDEFNREFECVRVAAVKGSILGRYVDQADAENRIGHVPHEPGAKVYTAWDLGVHTRIWFAQKIGAETRLIDYYSDDEGLGLPAYAKVLQEKPYVYAQHFAPHDIALREMGTGKARLEIAAQLGIFFTVLPQVSQTVQKELLERVEAAKVLLPTCWFDKVKCKRGLDALRSWRWKENAQLGELTELDVHDWASHGGDALTHLAKGLYAGASVRKVYAQPSTRWVR